MTHDEDQQSDIGHGKISRRTVMRAAAWTAPAIMIATASPASAAASGTMAAVSVVGDEAGNSGDVTFTAVFAGTSTGPHTATVTFPDDSLVAGLLHGWRPKTQVVSIPDGGGPVEFDSSFKIVLGLLPSAAPSSTVINFNVDGHTSNNLAAAISS